MAPGPPPALLPAPTVAVWRELLAADGTVELTSFNRMELAAVGAGSPLRGLVADETFLATGADDLRAAMQGALHGLIERGLAGEPQRDRRTLPSAPDQVSIPLGGDLAAIVAVRREPALLATVSAGPPEAVRHPGTDQEGTGVIAVLHGVASGEAGGLFALLEETTTARGVHMFALSTPAAQAERILEAWHQLEEDGPAAVSVHLFVPDPERPRHTQLALESGVARLSADGLAWQRSLPDYEWTNMFIEAATSTSHP